MELRANWNYPTSVRFGAGRISELADAVKAAGMTNPLFVTDPFLARQPMTQKAAASVGNARIFSEIKSNPVEANVIDGVQAMTAGGMTA
jgi:Alcohol dehydrogenase, class IV